MCLACLMQLTIVGRVMSVQDNATRLILVIDDGTGKIEVALWLNDTDPEAVRIQLCTHGSMLLSHHVQI